MGAAGVPNGEERKISDKKFELFIAGKFFDLALADKGVCPAPARFVVDETDGPAVSGIFRRPAGVMLLDSAVQVIRNTRV